MVWRTPSDLEQARTVAVPGPGSLGAQAWAVWNDEPPPDNRRFLEKFLSVAEANQLFATFKDGNKLPRRVPQLDAILTYASFPATYLHADIAAMLTSTGKLTDSRTVEQRMTATGMRMTNLYTHAQPDNGGMIGALRLGRNHALFHQQVGGVNMMNQVSMAFTLLTFSHVVLQSPRCGQLSAPVAEGWLKMWNAIGGLMGIVEDGLPITIEDATALYQLILASPQCATLSIEGGKLVAAYAEAFGSRTPDLVETYGGAELARRLELIT